MNGLLNSDTKWIVANQIIFFWINRALTYKAAVHPSSQQASERALTGKAGPRPDTGVEETVELFCPFPHPHFDRRESFCVARAYLREQWGIHTHTLTQPLHPTQPPGFLSYSTSTGHSMDKVHGIQLPSHFLRWKYQTDAINCKRNTNFVLPSKLFNTNSSSHWDGTKFSKSVNDAGGKGRLQSFWWNVA